MSRPTVPACTVCERVFKTWRGLANHDARSPACKTERNRRFLEGAK